MASVKKSEDKQDLSKGGIFLSATLDSFSLSIYSPHQVGLYHSLLMYLPYVVLQQVVTHDALLMELNRFTLSASRVKRLIDNDQHRADVGLYLFSAHTAAPKTLNLVDHCRQRWQGHPQL